MLERSASSLADMTGSATMPLDRKQSCELGLASAGWLADRLSRRGSSDRPLFILDCRTSSQFQRVHIVRSINVTLPGILYKRLIKGTLPLSSALPSQPLRETFHKQHLDADVLIISEDVQSPTDDNSNQSPHVSTLLLKQLWQKGCSAKLLKGTHILYYWQQCQKWCTDLPINSAMK